MKTLKRIFVAALILVGFGMSSFAQSTETASSTATLITPISITKNVDLNFGIVAASATAGTVVLDYADARTTTGGVTLPAGSTLQKTAQFTVYGDGNSTFSILLPTGALTMTGATEGMTVSGITCDLGNSGTLSSGSKVLKVKATLNVPANTIAGTYSNASDLFVTVNYN